MAKQHMRYTVDHGADAHCGNSKREMSRKAKPVAKPSATVLGKYLSRAFSCLSPRQITRHQRARQMRSPTSKKHQKHKCNTYQKRARRGKSG